jgi:dynein heavy chain
MHENANISYQLQEARRLIRTVIDVQPRLSTGATGKSSEAIVMETVSSILSEWPELISIEMPTELSSSTIQKLFQKDESGRMLNSLSTVLLQEASRFNKLSIVVRTSLESILKAVKGLIVMSADLELVFRSLINNQVLERILRLIVRCLKNGQTVHIYP